MVSRGVERRITSTLFVSQSLFSGSLIMTFTLMPIISAQLSGSDSAAGVPPTMMLIGRAAAAVWSFECNWSIGESVRADSNDYWNFCFIAGSSLLSETLSPFERGRAQGANEMMVVLGTGAGSLGTGIVFANAGIVAVSAIGLVFSLGLFGRIVFRAR